VRNVDFLIAHALANETRERERERERGKEREREIERERDRHTHNESRARQPHVTHAHYAGDAVWGESVLAAVIVPVFQSLTCQERKLGHIDARKEQIRVCRCCSSATNTRTKLLRERSSITQLNRLTAAAPQRSMKAATAHAGGARVTTRSRCGLSARPPQRSCRGCSGPSPQVQSATTLRA
jgi:hypothetical protein